MKVNGNRKALTKRPPQTGPQDLPSVDLALLGKPGRAIQIISSKKGFSTIRTLKPSNLVSKKSRHLQRSLQEPFPSKGSKASNSFQQPSTSTGKVEEISCSASESEYIEEEEQSNSPEVSSQLRSGKSYLSNRSNLPVLNSFNSEIMFSQITNSTQSYYENGNEDADFSSEEESQGREDGINYEVRNYDETYYSQEQEPIESDRESQPQPCHAIEEIPDDEENQEEEALNTQPKPAAKFTLIENEAIRHSLGADHDKIIEMDLEEKIQFFKNDHHYTLDDPDQVLVTFENIEFKHADLIRLAPDTFLNDTGVNFFLKLFSKYNFSQEAKDDCHLFNTYFFRSLDKFLTQNRGSLKSEAQEKMFEAYKSMSKCHKTVDLFTKKYLIIPVHKKGHWSLIIVANLASLLLEIEKLQPVSVKYLKPMIIYLDPLWKVDDALGELVRAYLEAALKVTLGDEVYKKKIKEYANPDEPFLVTENNMPSFQAILPRQTNSSDCGLLMLEYIECFCVSPYSPKEFLKKLLSYPFDLLQLFPHSSITNKRIMLTNIIMNVVNKMSLEEATEDYLDKWNGIKDQAVSIETEFLAPRELELYNPLPTHLLKQQGSGFEFEDEDKERNVFFYLHEWGKVYYQQVPEWVLKEIDSENSSESKKKARRLKNKFSLKDSLGNSTATTKNSSGTIPNKNSGLKNQESKKIDDELAVTQDSYSKEMQKHLSSLYSVLAPHKSQLPMPNTNIKNRYILKNPHQNEIKTDSQGVSNATLANNPLKTLVYPNYNSIESQSNKSNPFLNSYDSNKTLLSYPGQPGHALPGQAPLVTTTFNPSTGNPLSFSLIPAKSPAKPSAKRSPKPSASRLTFQTTKKRTLVNQPLKSPRPQKKSLTESRGLKPKTKFQSNCAIEEELEAISLKSDCEFTYIEDIDE